MHPAGDYISFTPGKGEKRETNMKAIINGQRYDTEAPKAVLIGEASSDYSRTDFQWWKAGLYRTKPTGKFFLAGTGGPMTMFAHRAQNGSQGGSKLIPLDKNDAREWAERYLTIAEIEWAFSDIVEDA